MGLLFDEDELVRNVMGQLMPLLSDVVSTLSLCMMISTLTFCLGVFTYCLREYFKDKREGKLHVEQLKQLQRSGGGRNMRE